MPTDDTGSGAPSPASVTPPNGPTLAEQRPTLSTAQWIVRFVAVVAVVVVLLWSWRLSGIDPAELWQKRSHAYEFLFGRSLEPEEVARAEALAERQLRIMAEQDARVEILREYEQAGESPPDPQELARLVDERADAALASMDPAARERVLEEEIERNLGAQRGGFFPPEVEPTKLRTYSDALLETVAIAIWGTLLAVVTSVPAALLAADRSLRILAPGDGLWSRALRWFALSVVRRLFDVCRGFNEYVMALIFVAVIGLGPFPGVLALAVHTFGMLGKIISEAIETIDEGPLEGVAATGASGAQTVAFAVMPQVMPFIVSQSLLRFESNVRSATVLGVVGAGGIGFLLNDKLAGFKLHEVCTIMIMIILVVSAIDLICGRAMRRFI
jgi:phosphonate transport system permease protein